jgi:hypothetical protein
MSQSPHCNEDQLANSGESHNPEVATTALSVRGLCKSRRVGRPISMVMVMAMVTGGFGRGFVLIHQHINIHEERERERRDNKHVSVPKSVFLLTGRT